MPVDRPETPKPSNMGRTSRSMSECLDEETELALPKRMTFAHDGYEEDWPDLRKNISKVLMNKYVECALTSVILFNIWLLIQQTDYDASDVEPPAWISTTNYLLILVYTVELGIRIYAWRQFFFKSSLNWFDLSVVVIDVLLELLFLVFDSDQIPSLTMLRIFRILRICRSRRACALFPELSVVVLGLFGAIRAMFWGIILLVIVLSSFGILAVQLIHPLARELAADGAFNDCERCGRAFGSVAASSLTLFQSIIAGDSWGMVAIPIVERYPFAMLFFAFALAGIGTTIMNLILAAVVDSGQQSRVATDKLVADSKKMQYNSIKTKLARECDLMDLDQTGSLTLKELEHGFQYNTVFRDLMESLGVEYRQVTEIFNMMDEDCNGHVSFREFVDLLYRMKTEDDRSMIFSIKYYVKELQREMRLELERTKSIIIALEKKVQATSEAFEPLVCNPIKDSAHDFQPKGALSETSVCNSLHKQQVQESVVFGLSLERMLQEMRQTLDELVNTIKSQSARQQGATSCLTNSGKHGFRNTDHLKAEKQKTAIDDNARTSFNHLREEHKSQGWSRDDFVNDEMQTTR